MSHFNRVKCDATISSSGVIVVGAAKPGFLAPTNLWTDGSTMTGTPGAYTYLLESAAGAWEIGCVQVSYAAPDIAGGIYRNVLQSSDGAFANSTTGLTMTLIVSAESMWAVNRLASGDAPPSAWGTSMAAGVGAKAADRTNGAVAVGPLAQTTGNNAVGLGRAVTAAAESVAVGSGAGATSFAVAVGSGAAVSGSGSSIGGVAVGYSALSSGLGAVAVGHGAAPAGADSVAIGRLSSTTADGGGVAIGHKASTSHIKNVAVGELVNASHYGEVAFGAAVRGRTRMIPVGWVNDPANASSGTEFAGSDGSGAYGIALGAIDSYLGTRFSGAMRVTGTVSIEDVAHTGNTAYLKVFSVDYLAWIVGSTGVVSVLGTPTITAMFTGASVPNSTLAISTEGVPKITTTYTGGLTAYGVLNIDDLQSSLE